MSAVERPEVDFDQFSDEFGANRHAEWAKMRQCPVAHNARYGGFWVVSGYDEVVAVSRDGATFSSKYEEDSPDGIEYIGIMGVPRMPGVPSAKIAEVEGPTHVALRRLLNPFMLPSAVAEYRPFVEQCATWLLDQKIADGQMDMVSDFTNPVPAILTMKMVGLPCESWTYYAEVFHAVNAYETGTEEFTRAQTMMAEMIGELLRVAEERRHDPRPDIISELVALEVEGGPPARGRARRRPVEPDRRGARYDDVAHRTLAVPPRRAPRPAPAPHRRSRAADPGHRGVPPVHLGQRDPQPDGDQGRRARWPKAEPGRLPDRELALGELRREGVRAVRRSGPRPLAQPAHGVRSRAAPLRCLCCSIAAAASSADGSAAL